MLLVNNTADDRRAPGRCHRRFATGTFVQNERPLSFAANQNLLMRRAHGRYLLALNSDTLVTPGALAELLRFAETRPQCGVVGPRLVHPDGSLQPSCRNFPSALDPLSGGLGALAAAAQPAERSGGTTICAARTTRRWRSIG